MIKVSDYEHDEYVKRNYEHFKELTKDKYAELGKLKSMMSTNVWCDVKLTAIASDQSCHPCGNWFAYSKGKELDRVELSISDNPEGMNKATTKFLQYMIEELKAEIIHTAHMFGFEPDNL